MGASIAVPALVGCSKTGERTTAAEWLCRIRAEYLEVPGLSLTRQQAKRLWGLDDLMCESLLGSLIDARFLRLTPSGTYVRCD